MTTSKREAWFDGDALRRARETAGLTRTQIAGTLATDDETVRLWEEGAVRPLPKNLPRVATAVGLPVEELWRSAEGTPSLADLRAMAGMNQAELALALGQSRATISKIELGKAPLPPGSAEKWAEALGVSVGDVEAAANTNTRQPPSGRGPRRRPRLVLVYRRRIEPGAIHGVGERAVAAYSPQGFDTEPHSIELPSTEWDEKVILGVMLGLRLDAGGLLVSKETQTEENGFPPFALRLQVEPKHQGRNLAELFLRVMLTHVPFKGELHMEEAVRDEARERLFAAFPSDHAEERLFIVALPSDTWGWLREQGKPGVVHVAAIADLDRDPFLTVIAVDDKGFMLPDGGRVAPEALGLTDDTTLREAAARLAVNRTGFSGGRFAWRRLPSRVVVERSGWSRIRPGGRSRSCCGCGAR